MKKKSIKYLVGIAVTALALWLSFKNLDWQTLGTSFSQVNKFWVVLATLNVLVSVFIMGWRWQILLKSKVNSSLWELFRFNIIAQYLNILIPARFGELLKAFLVSRKHKISGSYVLGTVVIEKVAEYFTIVLLGVLAPLMFTFQTQLKGYTWAVFLFAALIPLSVSVIWKRRKVLQWLARLASIFPERISRRLLNFLEKGIEAFTQLKDLKVSLVIMVITFLVFGSQVVTNLFLFEAYGFDLSILEALILQMVLIIGMSLPSVPGRIGVFEYTVVLALSMFNVDNSIALSFGLLLHVIAYLPKIILGFIFSTSLNISLKATQVELGKFEGEVKSQQKGEN